MKHTNSTKSNLFTSKVNIKLNVFSPTMLNWVMSKVDRTDIIAEQWLWLWVDEIPVAADEPSKTQSQHAVAT
jgi:hypothetical protein